jgi:hypothetical protein
MLKPTGSATVNISESKATVASPLPPSQKIFSGFSLFLLALVLMLTGLVMLLNQPVPLKVQFGPQNVEEYQQSGFYGPETDADGNRYRWTNGQASLTILLRARHPVRLNLLLRNAAIVGGPTEATQVRANGVVVGTLEPKIDGAKFVNYSLEFQPPYPELDTEKLQLELITPAFRPPGDTRQLGVMVAGLEIDSGPVWEPYISRTGWLDLALMFAMAIGLVGLLLWGNRAAGWLALPFGVLLAQAFYEQTARGWLLPVLALLVALAVASWLWFGPRPKLLPALQTTGSLLAIIGCGVSSFILLVRLLLLGLMGYPGQHYLAGPPYLAFFATSAIFALALAGLALFYFPLSAGSGFYFKLQTLARPLVARYPNLALLFYFGLANLIFIAIVYAQQLIIYGSLENLWRHWDSPSYLINAVTLYNPNNPILTVPTFSKSYWLSSFPGYSVLVRLLSYPFGYLPSLLFGNLLIAPLFAFALYRLLRDFGYAQKPLWVSTLALVLPERWLSDRAIASSEPLAMLGLTSSFYFYKKQQYWLAGLAGMLAVFARPTSIPFYVGLLLALGWEAYEASRNRDYPLRSWLKNFKWAAALKLSLMPLAQLLVYGFMGLRTGDPLAYFHISDSSASINRIGLGVPFVGLYNEAGQFGEFYAYLLPLLGLAVSWKRRQFDLFWAGLSLYSFSIFLLHMDVARYLLPAFPFTVILPFAGWIERRELRPVWLIACVMAYFFTFYYLSTSLIDRDLWQRLVQHLPR